ncbi:MAG: nucleotidyl transferase AbiEii/AbiGii toxin family protein [Candidatus Omnitrophica bacterium]|nr:nucleotidyl transferase AbiEii/AbiGii toxin family protein [Candidatus Omnitrophota bacterium]
MIISLLAKQDLSLLNKRSLKYKLADAEKDYMLAIVSKIIYDSTLRDKLVFKGGTAIHHCYAPQLRFSEDLDFTSLDKSIGIEEVKVVLESQDFLEVKKHNVSKATIKIERLSYAGPLGLPNFLKVNIDFLQNVVLPARELEYKNAWGVKTKVKIMDIKEICAEKIRATSDRARYRDFYDLFSVLKDFKLNIQEIIELIKQKEIRQSITKASILANWKIAKMEKQEKVARIYYLKAVPDSDIEKMINSLGINEIKK